MTHKKKLALAGVVVLIGTVSAITMVSVTHQSRSSSAAVVRTPSPLTISKRPVTPAGTPVPSARPASSAAPSSGFVSYFRTLPPGSVLPGDAQCAREIARNPWEPRPENRAANQANVYAQGFRLHNSYLASWEPAYERRVTGNFTGTTDQILRWGACKWGFDEDSVRAQSVLESTWRQSTLGDCNGGKTQPETRGCASVGILQVKGADLPPTFPGVWPAAWTSTAFNVDFALGVRRLCYDGKETWLRDSNPSYAAGDLWGCIGKYFSGRWHDPSANQYIQKVQTILAAKIWRTF
jgi:hypothetical protein